MPSLINYPPMLDLTRFGGYSDLKKGKNFKVTACPHISKKPFAKSMCHKCY